MKNPYTIVSDFEETVAEFTGFKYAVAVESCTAALFLCLQYRKKDFGGEITIPKYTYPGVAASIVNSGYSIAFVDAEWQDVGWYKLEPLSIIDSAKYISQRMHDEMAGNSVCISFHVKKVLPIGRGGVVLSDSKEECEWIKLARFDGRHECPLERDTLAMSGWNMYMTPEQAARGMMLMTYVTERGFEMSPKDTYLDLSKYDFYTKANR